jgi:hypothetical protein
LLGVTMIPEQQVHDRFQHLWVRGEWFQDTTELRAFIEDSQHGGLSSQRCECCGGAFFSTDKRKKYCSAKCRVKNFRKIRRTVTL